MPDADADCRAADSRKIIEKSPRPCFWFVHGVFTGCLLWFVHGVAADFFFSGFVILQSFDEIDTSAVNSKVLCRVLSNL